MSGRFRRRTRKVLVIGLTVEGIRAWSGCRCSPRHAALIMLVGMCHSARTDECKSCAERRSFECAERRTHPRTRTSSPKRHRTRVHTHISGCSLVLISRTHPEWRLRTRLHSTSWTTISLRLDPSPSPSHPRRSHPSRTPSRFVCSSSTRHPSTGPSARPVQGRRRSVWRPQPDRR